MAWLKSLRKKNDDAAVAVADEEEVEEEPQPALPAGPQLAVLIPDIAGISSFRLRLFPSAAAAQEHITGLSQEVRRGAHAFWALHEPPLTSENAQTETLVLIRASQNADVVYVVSFLDIESAHSFTRFEVRRGLDLGNVLIYWAALAQVREELSGVTIIPQEAPLTQAISQPVIRNQAAVAPPRPAAPRIAAPVEEAPSPVAEPEPAPAAPESAVEAEARVAVERYLKRQEDEPTPPHVTRPARTTKPAAEPEPAEELEPIVALEPVEAAIEAELEDEGEGLPLWPQPVAAAQPLIDAIPGTESEFEQAARDEFFTEQPDELAAIDEAVVISHELVAQAPEPHAAEPSAQTMLYSEGVEGGMIAAPTFESEDGNIVASLASGIGLTEPGQVTTPEIIPVPPTVTGPADDDDRTSTEVDSSPGDEERDHPWPQALRVADVPSSVEGQPATPMYDAFDIAYEVERLRNRRHLDKREGPFDGFKSPPGRF